jgi:hypothetical protein
MNEKLLTLKLLSVTIDTQISLCTVEKIALGRCTEGSLQKLKELMSESNTLARKIAGL